MVEYYRICRPTSRNANRKAPARALAEFAQQLLTAQPDEAARAFDPLVTLFEGVLADAEEAGVIRAGIPRRRVAGVVLEAIMFNAFSSTIGGAAAGTKTNDAAEELWGLIFYGIGAPARPCQPGRWLRSRGSTTPHRSRQRPPRSAVASW